MLTPKNNFLAEASIPGVPRHFLHPAPIGNWRGRQLRRDVTQTIQTRYCTRDLCPEDCDWVPRAVNQASYDDFGCREPQQITYFTRDVGLASQPNTYFTRILSAERPPITYLQGIWGHMATNHIFYADFDCGKLPITYPVRLCSLRLSFVRGSFVRLKCKTGLCKTGLCATQLCRIFERFEILNHCVNHGFCEVFNHPKRWNVAWIT